MLKIGSLFKLIIWTSSATPRNVSESESFFEGCLNLPSYWKNGNLFESFHPFKGLSNVPKFSALLLTNGIWASNVILFKRLSHLGPVSHSITVASLNSTMGLVPNMPLRHQPSHSKVPGLGVSPCGRGLGCGGLLKLTTEPSRLKAKVNGRSDVRHLSSERIGQLRSGLRRSTEA